jgi:hypothetical protein
MLVVSRKGIIQYHKESEFLNLKWVRPLPPPCNTSVYHPHLGPTGGDTLACEGGGRGDPIQTTGQKLWCSILYSIPLRGELFHGVYLRPRKSRGTVALNMSN